MIGSLESKVQQLEIPLEKGGEAFWLDDRTIAHVVEGDGKKSDLFALPIKFEAQSSSAGISSEPATLIGSFPTASATNFRYSSRSGRLVFSDYVYPDGDLTKVKEKDEAWENRGTSALVYDATFVRHWDTWVGPKQSSLFSVELAANPDHKWVLGTDFVNVLKDTGHVGLESPIYLCGNLMFGLKSSPVEPFGGTDDFDVSKTQIVYTAKDPSLPQAWHTKQNVRFLFRPSVNF